MEKIKCRLCGQEISECLLDLGMTPLANRMIEESEIGKGEKYYPLRISRCPSCGLIQIMDDIDPYEIFHDYPYYSSFSKGWLEHAMNYSKKIKKQIKNNATIVEIACNDGYLLQNFLGSEYTIYGVEPSENVANVARLKGIETINDFFGVKLANKMVTDGIRADLMIANNVVIEVPDINDFIEGFYILLSDDGIATFEFQYIKNIIDKVQFDTIFHEHYSYFSLTVFQKLLLKHGLEAYDVEDLETHGGSLRVYVKKIFYNKKISNRLVEYINSEDINGVNTAEYYNEFRNKVRIFKNELREKMADIKNQGQTIAAFGAAAKGNTLLNYCGIGKDYIDFVVDDITYKQGKFLPGTRIPVYSIKELEKRKPDYLLVLPWNLESEIIKKTTFIYNWGGKHIIPTNKMKCISKPVESKVIHINKEVLFIYNEERIKLPESEREKIENYWNYMVKKGKNYFNGDVYSVYKYLENEKQLIFYLGLTDYKHLIYTKEHCFRNPYHTCSIASVALLLTKDGYLVLGKMALQTAFSGQYKCIGGGLDIIDMKNQIVVPEKIFQRELKEEIGINITDPKICTDIRFRWLLVREKLAFIGVCYEINLTITRNELEKIFNEYKVIDKEGELEELLFIANEDELCVIRSEEKADYVDELLLCFFHVKKSTEWNDFIITIPD